MGLLQLLDFNIMQCHREKILLLDKDALVDKFAIRNTRRMALENVFKDK